MFYPKSEVFDREQHSKVLKEALLLFLLLSQLHTIENNDQVQPHFAQLHATQKKMPKLFFTIKKNLQNKKKNIHKTVQIYKNWILQSIQTC